MLEVSKDTFTQEVLEAEQKVLVDFWAPWCGPCRMMTPIVEEVETLNPDVKFVSVNIDEEPELAEAHGIKSIPHYLAFNEGEKVGQFSGAQPLGIFNSHVRNIT